MRKSTFGMLLKSTILCVWLLPALSCSAAPSQPPPASPAPAPLTGAAPSPAAPPTTPVTKVQFMGQSCFMITSASGVKIIVDPYTTSERTYSAINESADIVTVSHEHSDHNDTKAIKGDPEIIRGLVSKAVKGITFSGVASFHDNVQGTQRGANTIFLFAVDGIRFCHLGDLGHRLNSEKMAEIGPVDVLFIPVGGTFTIDAAMATTVAEDLKPKIVLPMHYRTPKSNPTVVPVDDFIKGKANVEQLTGSILELKKDTLPAQMRIIVLQHAR